MSVRRRVPCRTNSPSSNAGRWLQDRFANGMRWDANWTGNVYGNNNGQRRARRLSNRRRLRVSQSFGEGQPPLYALHRANNLPQYILAASLGYPLYNPAHSEFYMGI